MLVFRNQTSYNRFWDGRNEIALIITVVRNLSRAFLGCDAIRQTTGVDSKIVLAERAQLDSIIRILVAILYATKNHLRAAWGAEILTGATLAPGIGMPTSNTEYEDLLPPGFNALDDRGVGLPLQLTFFVEQYIKRGTENGRFQGPQASQMQVQLYRMTEAFGRMETIRLTSSKLCLPM